MKATIPILILTAVALSGCAGSLTSGGLTVSPSVSSSLQNIGAFTMTDLQNADKIAVANKDTLADTCFLGLEAFVAEQQAMVGGLTTNTVSGAFSAVEQARVGANGLTNAISKTQIQALETACAPLVADQLNDQAAFLANIASLGKL